MTVWRETYSRLFLSAAVGFNRNILGTGDGATLFRASTTLTLIRHDKENLGPKANYVKEAT